MKTAIYLRTSTDKQEKGLESQKRAALSYCASHGICNFEIFEDFGISGARESRKALNQMMVKVRSGEFDRVVVPSFSRFARSTKFLLSSLEEFSSLGVAFVSISESIDTDTPVGKLVFVVVSAISEFERELVRSRVKRGLENAREKGRRLGRPTERNSELIRKLRSQGMKYEEIAKFANCSIATVSRELAGFFRS